METHRTNQTHVAPLLLYDGECGVCSRFVDAILRLESDNSLTFAALDSPIGREMQAAYGIDEELDTVVLIEEERAHVHSDAVLSVAKYLRRPYRWVKFLGFFPRPLRDWAYRTFAANRYILGGNAACRLVSPDERARFLDLSSVVPEEDRSSV